RERVGRDGLVMVDANNGYNLNLTKQFLAATREADLHWLEEPFHEDRVLYEDLKDWLGEQGLSTQIADGEGQASPSLLDMAQAGLIDLVQYDAIGYGFCRWLELGAQLDAQGVRSAPHNYGSLYGNYAACHLAPGIAGFALVEWDEAQAPGLDTSAYRIEDGLVAVPDRPGFGLELDEAHFARLVASGGWSVGS
ncbi:MAG TPA: enolase C-terminal domain-like protein, partial [Limnochordia bacterium]|nr:enolase C-terminal domain-like protein [Limnochordia bacterium]